MHLRKLLKELLKSDTSYVSEMILESESRQTWLSWITKMHYEKNFSLKVMLKEILRPWRMSERKTELQKLQAMDINIGWKCWRIAKSLKALVFLRGNILVVWFFDKFYSDCISLHYILNRNWGGGGNPHKKRVRLWWPTVPDSCRSHPPFLLSIKSLRCLETEKSR